MRMGKFFHWVDERYCLQAEYWNISADDDVPWRKSVVHCGSWWFGGDLLIEKLTGGW